MNRKTIKPILVTIALIWSTASAEKVLIYDEQRGIIFADKDEHGNIIKPPSEDSQLQPQQQSQDTRRPEATVSPRHNPGPVAGRDKNDIQAGRKKDPPELYFSSGLEYFKNGDYVTALKNFAYADSVSPKPEYQLWKGKTYRQLGRQFDMLTTMKGILDKYPASDVADDALFEIAFYYQTTDDYEKANKLYQQLAEQYPFGTSYSNGEEFRDITRQQRSYMRAEMVNLLSILGYGDDDESKAYTQFQKAHHLEVTGTATRETVRAIKQMHRDYLLHEKNKAAEELAAKRHVLWGIVVGAAGVVNILMLVVMRFVIASRKRTLDVLRQSLADLDLQKSIA